MKQDRFNDKKTTLGGQKRQGVNLLEEDELRERGLDGEGDGEEKDPETGLTPKGKRDASLTGLGHTHAGDDVMAKVQAARDR